ITGKIQAQCIVLSYFQQVCDWLAYGFDMAAIRVNSDHFFRLQRRRINDDEETNLILGASDEQVLDDVLREMFAVLGLQENHSA
ncbi:hypothetical protein, partial [Erwinia amylovora]|uniref:hypothetical protein n=1 Tax=Erwinia amylovora TaxID=552 RepID=UPI0020C00882